jgi:hypothetical protein
MRGVHINPFARLARVMAAPGDAQAKPLPSEHIAVLLLPPAGRSGRGDARSLLTKSNGQRAPHRVIAPDATITRGRSSGLSLFQRRPAQPGRLQCHASASGGWLLLTRGAIVWTRRYALHLMRLG